MPVAVLSRHSSEDLLFGTVQLRGLAAGLFYSLVLLFCCPDFVRVWFALMLELATLWFAHYLSSLSPLCSLVNMTLWALLLVP